MTHVVLRLTFDRFRYSDGISIGMSSMVRDLLAVDRGAGSGRKDRQRLLSNERHGRILEQLKATGSISVSAIAAELSVSEMTVRRDLVGLERDGRLTRVHGGAVPSETSANVAMDSEEPLFDARLRRGLEAKRAIAAYAANLVADYRALALDVGTTTYLVAGFLRKVPDLKVFTNSLRVATRLDGGAPDVYVAGGLVRAEEMSVYGPTAVAQFEKLWFDAAIIGTSGITSDGFFDYSFEDTDVKRVYLRRSGLRILVCDSAKFQRMSLVQIGSFAEINMLVTDAEPPPQIAAALAAARVDVHVAPPVAANADQLA
jgi:DeoR family glycerol-3-phosphate regulon repressor